MEKKLSEFLRALVRCGVVILDWRWVKEWHKDGYPHWHVLILTDKPGQAGMIGGDLLRKCWPWARWVREEYFKSENHWRAFIGYAAKTGYMHKQKDKRYQAELPVWAKNISRRIRRVGMPQGQDPVADHSEDVEELEEWMSRFKPRPSCTPKPHQEPRRTNGAVLASCGERVVVMAALVSEEEEYRDFGEVAYPYDEWVRHSTFYVSRWGCARLFTKAEFREFYSTHKLPPPPPTPPPYIGEATTRATSEWEQARQDAHLNGIIRRSTCDGKYAGSGPRESLGDGEHGRAYQSSSPNHRREELAKRREQVRELTTWGKFA